MSEFRYTLRRVEEGTQPTPALSLEDTLTELAAQLALETTGPRRLKYDERLHVSVEDVPRLLDKIRARFEAASGPDRLVVVSATGPSFAMVELEVKAFAPTGSHSGPVDLIYGAVHARFDPQFEVRDMGICVDKPGEHGRCNAWDGGTTQGVPATVTWERIELMAAWIRQQGIRHDETNGLEGLPVNGVIVQDRYWESDRGREWRAYSGTKHVSHFHVSGKPSLTGWV